MGESGSVLGVMGLTKKKLASKLASVRDRMAAACQRVKRDPSEVTLVAVTKSVDIAVIKDLIDLGQLDIAESRVQQLAQRREQLGPWLARRSAATAGLRWHMVGHLQRNKVKACLAAADVIHSIDSLRLAEDLSARAERDGQIIECLLEVNCANESRKGGVAVGAAFHLAEQISTLPNIRLLGLMTMAPQVDDPQDARFAFTRLQELFEEMVNEKVGGSIFRHLSMGMSNDFEAAIEEGATIVRVGSALFAE